MIITRKYVLEELMKRKEEIYALVHIQPHEMTLTDVYLALAVSSAFSSMIADGTIQKLIDVEDD